MLNELLFIAHAFIVGGMALVALALGRQALVAFISVQAILANLFVIKQIKLFGFTATAADVYIVGSVLGLNLLQEYYGKKIARNAIWASFAMLIFYTIVSQFQIWYLPGVDDFAHDHFQALLHHMPRIAIASIFVYLIVQHIDSFTFDFLKRIMNKRFFVVRNYLTISFSQLIDTVLFTVLALYGIIPDIFQVMIVSYTIKMIMVFLVTPLIGLTHKIAEPMA